MWYLEHALLCIIRFGEVLLPHDLFKKQYIADGALKSLSSYLARHIICCSLRRCDGKVQSIFYKGFRDASLACFHFLPLPSALSDRGDVVVLLQQRWWQEYALGKCWCLLSQTLFVIVTLMVFSSFLYIQGKDFILLVM